MNNTFFRVAQLAMRPVKAINHELARSSLIIARFLTQMGRNKSENKFWRMGAWISLAGVAIAIAAHMETLWLVSQTSQPWTKALAYQTGIHGLLLFLVSHIGIGLWRGLREEFGK